MGYKITKKIRAMGDDINEIYQELLTLAEDSGKASTLAWLSVVMNDDAISRSTIRNMIDEAVGELSLEATDLYCELKTEHAKENRK